MTLQGLAAVAGGFAVMVAIVMAGTALAALAMGRSISAATASKPSPAYMVYDFVLGMAAAAVGGLAVGRLAPFAPMAHGVALAAVVLAMAVWCVLSYGDNGPPRWYQALMSFTSAAAVVTTAAQAA